jgi:hypothetical protein
MLLESVGGTKKVSCKICNHPAVKEGFCKQHLKAYRNLVDSFALWQRALPISWKEYLSQIAEISSAGNWVKEVAEYLKENGEQ